MRKRLAKRKKECLVYVVIIWFFLGRRQGPWAWYTVLQRKEGWWVSKCEKIIGKYFSEYFIYKSFLEIKVFNNWWKFLKKLLKEQLLRWYISCNIFKASIIVDSFSWSCILTIAKIWAYSEWESRTLRPGIFGPGIPRSKTEDPKT